MYINIHTLYAPKREACLTAQPRGSRWLHCLPHQLSAMISILRTQRCCRMIRNFFRSVVSWHPNILAPHRPNTHAPLKYICMYVICMYVVCIYIYILTIERHYASGNCTCLSCLACIMLDSSSHPSLRLAGLPLLIG